MSRNKKLKKLLVILGPTASGKSALALSLVKKYGGEIISADSRQIYQKLDIGTNKEKGVKKGKYYFVKGVKHFLISVIAPDKNFTLANFKNRALRAIKKIHKKGKLPILIGGTGLYIQAIVDNLSIPEVPPDKKLRLRLEKLSNKKLIEKLRKLDPAALKKISLENKRRLIRALEVCLKTGKKFSELQKKGKPLFNILQIGISAPKEKLYKKIDARVDKMIQEGLFEETKKLYKKYGDAPAFSGIGYGEIIQYLAGKITLEEAIRLIKRNTRRYSRRQMTWFKRDNRINWIKTAVQAEKIINKWLDKL